MTSALAVQGSLFEEPGDGRTRRSPTFRRDHLGRGAWVDVSPGWLADADDAYRGLLADVPWQAERRQMWDNVVDVPRLTCFYAEGEVLPHPAVDDAMLTLNARYAAGLGEPFVTAGLCLYRDGRDSVAWHGDRIGRGRDGETLVGIVSLGSRRNLMLRPRGGGQARRYALGHGDLVVMGGTCQRTWDHCIPKTAQQVGPRISVQLRPAGVR